MHLIGLDVGTTGCKAMVFDETGRSKGYAFREYCIDTDAAGKAEQDAEAVWSLSKEVLKSAVAASGIRASELAGLSLSVQGDAIIPVDVEHRAVYPAILGMDYRSRPQAEAAESRLGGYELFRRTGMRPHPMNSLVKMIWLKEERPEAFRRAAKICTYADFIMGKLGARHFIDYTMASRTMAFDLARREWAVDILGACGIEPGLLSEPVATGSRLGAIDPGLARELGLPPDLALVAGAHDQPAGAVGSGITAPGGAVVSTGTAEVLSTVFAEPALDRGMYEGFYPCYAAPVEGRYFTFALNHVGGLLLRWFRDQLGAAELARAAATGLDPYAVLTTNLPPGPASVLVLPHFNGSGTPWCDMDSKGAIVGLTMSTTRADIVRAILESQTYELRINLERMRASGIVTESLVASGGGAKSAAWLQAKADILGMPVRTLACKESGCLGAAVIAGFGAGLYTTIPDGARAAVRYDATVMPDTSLVSAYDAKFALYRDLYPTLRSLNTRL